ncbi:50S ribosomal protein L25/general stress protein Ctc [Cumulibacter manganitolerans]|uniref:50S ribosomal protein L25/general stress protein Ctc n=1 Tax=Cumulibacter manganitolerans TaxID=1884992 RepID=UPI001294BC6A|nr:50S ribosomal protein L25/general stress protein Ctc [Cumulibacter manganitolerans]
MSDEVRIEAATREDFGKGAARRARRDGQIPAVLYGHGMDPVHLNLHGHQLTMALRQGLNTLLTIKVDGKDELVLAKDVQVHPLRRVIQHADLLLVKKGEKVTVDVPVEVTGELVPGGQLNQDLTSVSVEAQATHIPESLSVDISSLEIGGQVLASDLQLPAGATLLTDGESLIVGVTEVVDADVETDAVSEEEAAGAEGEGAEAESESEGAAEGDAAEKPADE